MLIEGRTRPPGDVLDFDLCIVGSGPAGLAIAQRLEGSGLRIAVLESGGRHAGVREQRLNVGENVGRPYWPLYSARIRSLGGSGNRWGGWCRPFDPINLAERDWVAGSGWPIPYEEMARYHVDAEAFLGLPPDAFGEAGTLDPPPKAAGMDDAGLETVRYQFSPLQLHLGELLRGAVDSARDTTVLLHATVTDLRLAPGSSTVSHAVVRDRDGGTFEVRAKEFVLAAGGIENARLLLAARTDRPTGLGNEHDLVGRYFMEHLHAPVAYLLTGDPALRDPFFESIMFGLPGVDCGALAGSAEAQREERLLGLSLTVTPAPNRFGQPYMELPPRLGIPLQYLVRQATRPGRPQRADHPVDPAEADVPWLLDKVHALREPLRQARFAPTRRQLLRKAAAVGVRSPDVHVLYARSEQVPNPGSRVTLGAARDHLGMPVARLDWQLQEQDFANVEGWVARINRAMSSRAGSHVVAISSWRDLVEGGPHHMGTTRMSATAATGVVDARCKVHSLDNLHVAGSSVFPTGGYANPTLPLVALALRLADHLRERSRVPLVLDPTTP